MKRKPARTTDSAAGTNRDTGEIIAPQILDGARRLLAAEKGKPTIKCVVCSGDTPAGSADQLCWVCRRLKISAWRDVEQQAPAQE